MDSDSARPAAELAAVDLDLDLHPHLDLDGIERDLAGVEVALARLDDGSYWTDEVTGAPLPDELLVVQPTVRRLPEA